MLSDYLTRISHQRAGISRDAAFYWMIHAVFLSGSLYLFWPSLVWVGYQFSSQQHRFALLGAAILTGVGGYRILTQGMPVVRLHFAAKTWPLAVFMLSCAAYLLNTRFTGIQVFSAAFGIAAGYAIWGFYTNAHSWRQGALPAVLLILLLPFGDYLDVYFGFPLRLFTAHTASDWLAGMGFTSVSTDTLILLENRVANVDLSCSGIKGLWAGMVFFVLLTWIEGKPVTLHWLWRLAAFCGVLVAINVFRVVLIVVLGLGLNHMAFAELLHRGLGVLGFAFACLAGWGLLLSLKSKQPSGPGLPPQLARETKFTFQPGHLQKPPVAVLLVALSPIAFCCLYTPLPRQINNNTEATLNVQLPQSWNAQALELTAQEAEFFPRNSARAQKLSFHYSDTVRGSVIFVSADYWKAHHDPRNCLRAQGYHINADHSLRLSGDKSLRMLNVTRKNQQAIVLYWFQTVTHTTDDFSARLFSALLHRQQPWVMVSVILQTPAATAADIPTVMNNFSTVVNTQILQASS